MSWFAPFAVPADLRDRLACRYAATTAGRHDLIPDGSMDLLWVEGFGVILCGPDTHGWSFELAPGTAAVGVRFRPGAAAGVFHVDADELLDQRIDLADLVGDRRARTIAERMATAPDARQRMGLLEELVRRRVADEPPEDTVALAAIVAADPSHGVAGLAATAGLSTRQLRRRFDRAVGYGPAFFARVARVQRFARFAARSPHLGIAEVAAAAGYADQAHVAKDCRTIAGMTPRQLLAALPRSSVAIDVRAGPGDAVSDDRAVA